ncbi:MULTISPECIES: RidA family protein [Pseudomonas]|jgi:reactive intermediate/imine deaminase|uniref:RidA family protein n=1 Tax=Pseudomonas TaxID=286 RepID=UPI0008C8B9C1|nr:MULTISPECIES: Rid family detoxifying hydrolase [Pseudomonas]AUG01717.1 reactive intermediate/imine deaminase [Pseudomonas sp. 09C 129]MCP1479434.1 reactive intermediate/imine deaminase [Pseudomonas chlororaphis]MCP1594214.1 reactive intermediate/imine deaminase [Pseudomonas chlororaphis]PMY32634.1 reactive intermediate/imine deaminase [Pseudomonas sp. GW456-L14]PMY49775.1 reactive intermediate/imine deaminase [Pseudomonas sp. GW456-L12]
MKIVSTDTASPPAGHYSQAVIHQDSLYISGQLPVSPDGTHNIEASFTEQAHIALSNLLAILNAAGRTASDLVKVTVYVAGIKHWPAFDEIYCEMLGSHRPARAVVPVPELHHGYLVEIEAVARM